jgi:hypothetical protein
VQFRAAIGLWRLAAEEPRPGAAAELSRFIEAAEKVTNQNGRRPELVVPKGKVGTESVKLPQAQLPGSLPDLQTVEMLGEPGWDRTIDTLIKSQVLYH